MKKESTIYRVCFSRSGSAFCYSPYIRWVWRVGMFCWKSGSNTLMLDHSFWGSDSKIPNDIPADFDNRSCKTIIFPSPPKKPWFSSISWNSMTIPSSSRSHSYSSELTEFILFRRGTLKCALRIPRHQKSNLLNKVELCFDFKILCLPLQDSSVRSLWLGSSAT